MRLDYNVSSFVIVGNWNPNIVNETWIKKNLLDYPNQQVNMGFKGGGDPAGTRIHVSNIAAVFNHVVLTVSGDRLELNLDNSDDFKYIETCVQKLCKCQSNTLVSGYGVNFVYIEDRVSNEFTNCFTDDPLSPISLTENHRYVIHLDGITTNIAIELNKTTNKSAIVFNFHFAIKDLPALLQRLAEYPIAALNEKAVQFVLDKYGLRLES